MENSSQSSGFGRFGRGFGSGLFSASLMMGIYFLVSHLPFVTLLPVLGLPAIIGTVLVTGLFSGTMSVIRGKGHPTQQVPVVVNGASRGVSSPAQGQAVAIEQSADAPEQSGSKWADRVGRRSTDGQSFAETVQAERNNAQANGVSV